MKLFNNFLMGFLLIALIGCSSETETSTDADTDTSNGNGVTEEEAEEERGTLDMAFSPQPPVLDPHATSDAAVINVMRPVYETLITVDSEYSVQPMLADSWEQSDDGTTITFHLREGVLFHNGEEMTAEDVVASMERWKVLPAGRGLFTEATFEEIDDYTVELNLPEPLSTALVMLSHGGAGYAAIMPKEVVDNAPDEGTDEIVGTGPFQFEEWVQDQHVRFSRFDDYQSREEPADGLAGAREALVDEARIHFIDDSSTRVAGLQSGEYDIAHSVPYDSAEQLENDPNINNDLDPAAALDVHFNKSQGLFTDVQAREAIAAALDMESILTAAYTNDTYYELNHNMTMTHQHDQWYSDVGQDKYNENDPERAQQLLEEAGYDGEEIRIITTRDYEDNYNAAVVIQEQLQQIGMNIDLQVYDWATLFDLREDDTAYEIMVSALTPLPDPSINLFLQSDWPGWTESPELDEIIEDFRSQPSLEEAQPVYEELQEWYWDYIPIVKAGDYYRVYSSQDTVENFQIQDGPILWNVSNNE